MNKFTIRQHIAQTVAEKLSKDQINYSQLNMVSELYQKDFYALRDAWKSATYFPVMKQKSFKDLPNHNEITDCMAQMIDALVVSCNYDLDDAGTYLRLCKVNRATDLLSLRATMHDLAESLDGQHSWFQRTFKKPVLFTPRVEALFKEVGY